MLVDLAHEVMLRAWPRLRRWLSELRQAERVRRRLEQHADDWQRLASRGGGLLDAVETQRSRTVFQSPDAQELGVKVKRFVRWSAKAVVTSSRPSRLRAMLRSKKAPKLLFEQEREKGGALWRITATMTLLFGGSATVLSLGAARAALGAWYGKSDALGGVGSRGAQAGDGQTAAGDAAILTAKRAGRSRHAPDLAVLLWGGGFHPGWCRSRKDCFAAFARRVPLVRMIHTGWSAGACAGSVVRRESAGGWVLTMGRSGFWM